MFKHVLVLLAGCLLLVQNDLRPLLDGRTSPLVLTTQYTFTGYDWAVGDVTFLAGFVVNAGATAVLDITQPVFSGYSCSSTGTVALARSVIFVPDKGSNIVLSGGNVATYGSYNFSGPSMIFLGQAYIGNLTFFNSVILDCGAHDLVIQNPLSIKGYKSTYIQRKQVTIRNAHIVNSTDQSTGKFGSGPRVPLFGSRPTTNYGATVYSTDPKDLHWFIFDNTRITLQIDATNANEAPTMTFTTAKIAFANKCQIDSMADPGTKANVVVYSGLVFSSGGLTTIGPNINLKITPDMTGRSGVYSDDTNYFYFLPDIRTQIALQDSSLIFSQPLQFTSTSLLLDGTVTFAGSGGTQVISLNSFLGITGDNYGLDTIIDIHPSGRLVLDNVNMINYNYYK